MSTKVPEGYVLVNKGDLQSLQNLVRKVGNVCAVRQGLEQSVNDLNNRRSYTNSLREDKADLVSQFENTCQNSTLRSKIEDVKSICTQTLKTNMKEIQRKQNKSKKALRERFDGGAAELKSCYQSLLLETFENKTSLNNSLPIEQYACEEVVKSYRECLKTQLLPQMNQMYRAHCHKVDNALKEWNATVLVGLEDRKLSPAVTERISKLQKRISQMSQNTQHGSSFTRQMDNILQRVTEDIGKLTVERGTENETPSSLELVEACLDRADFQGALNHALVAMDLELLLSTCHRMSVDDVFGDVVPTQPILLALVNQLSHNLEQDLEVKSQFLLEGVQALDLRDQVIINNRETVNNELEKLVRQIDETRQHVTPRLYNTNLKQLRWATQQIIRQLEDY